MSRKEREEVFAVIDQAPNVNYIILFKGVLGRTDYRALYRQEYDKETDVDGQIVKVHGVAGAPSVITGDMVF